MDKKYICVSVKHTYYRKNGWYLWCPNFSGYTGDADSAGLYSPEDFKNCNFPVVKMRKDLARYYAKRYDSVLVEKDEFVNFVCNLRNCKSQEELDTVKTILHGLKCILTSESIEPNLRIEKALNRIDEVVKSI